MFWLIFACVIPSMAVCWAAGFAVRRLAPRWGLVDRPGHRKVHDGRCPPAADWPFGSALCCRWPWGKCAVGIAGIGRTHHLPTFVAVHLPGLLRQSGRLWELLAGGTVLLLLGLADDRRGLDWRLRLGVQTLVAVVLVSLGWRMSLFLDSLNMPWLTGALSVLWIVGLINSFNMLDNMDGLSAGVAAIAAAMLAAMMLLDASARQQPAATVRRRACCC